MKHSSSITLFLLLLGANVLVQCTTANPACVRAHKNIKKMHLKNWAMAHPEKSEHLVLHRVGSPSSHI